MKKLIAFLTIVFLVFLICSCTAAAEGSSEKEEGLAADSSGEPETGTDMPSGFPETVPIHDRAVIVESSREVIDGVESCFINMEFEGKIGQLSGWYKDTLDKDWQVDSISEGDYDDWAEFYVDAQNSQYYLSVYLYQDAGSDHVIIDINTKGKTEVAEIDEESQDAADRDQHEETATEATTAYSGGLEDAKISFVCASVGYAWNITEHFPSLDITVYDEYQFDKGNIIRDIMASDRPDIMIIKECAAYFPPEEMGSSMEDYRNLIRNWVNICRGEGVIPVLTTVVPIDPDNSSNWEGQLESILEFNDWIHEYCRSENISVLDLEAALRMSDGNRVLDPNYDSGDGLHPNDLAYPEKLDHILIPSLEEALEIGY